MPFLPLPIPAFIDVVGVFNSESFGQVFADAQPMRGTIRERTQYMKHPTERGILIADHRIILQNEIEIPFIITSDNYSSVYNEIKNLRQSGTLLSVQTRTGIYDNMVIEDMPHEESGEMFDAITIAVRFREVLFTPDPDTYAPEDPVMSDAVQEGPQQSSAVTFPAPMTQQAARSFTSGAVTVTPPIPTAGTISSGAVTVN